MMSIFQGRTIGSIRELLIQTESVNMKFLATKEELMDLRDVVENMINSYDEK